MNRGSCNSKKGFIVPLIIAIIALLTLGGYAYSQRVGGNRSVEGNPQSGVSSTSTAPPVEVPVVSAEKSQMSLRDILALTTPQTCTVSFIAHSIETKGTVYVADNKVRADFNTEVAGKLWNTHALLDGVFVYTWMDELVQGFKVAISTDISTSSKGSQGTDVNQKMGVECMSWTVDSSLFTIPERINFMSIGSGTGKSQ